MQIVPTRVEQEESDANIDFVLNMLPRIEYQALRQMASEVCVGSYCSLLLGCSLCKYLYDNIPCVQPRVTQVGVAGLPETLPANVTKEAHAELLALLHTVLVDVRSAPALRFSTLTHRVRDVNQVNFRLFICLTENDSRALVYSFQVHIQEGALVCRKCTRQYPIRQGIPNMLLQEHEV